MITLHATQAHRERSRAATAHRLLTKDVADEPDNGSGWVEWGVPVLYRMTATQFERWLVDKFGPEYLEPVNYRRLEDGTLVPEEGA